MSWVALSFSVLATIISALAVTIVGNRSRLMSEISDALSADLAAVSTRLGEIERTERLTPSKLAELADVQDAIAKGNALLKKVNSREVMRARRESGELDAPVTKEELRRRAGIIAGKPAPHA